MVKQILGFTHQYRKEGLMCLWLGPTYPIVFLFKPELAEVNCFSFCFCQHKSELGQPRPQGLLLVQNGSRRNPWPRLLKYSTNCGVFCHVTHDKMAFSDVVSSVWRPCLFSAIGNRCSNKTKTFHRFCVMKF